MSETIKAADAVIGKWYWVNGASWLSLDHDDEGDLVVYRPGIGRYYFDQNRQDVLPLPDDAGYDYELPPAEPDYAELHAKCGLQVGDRVRVTSKTEPNGWAYRWSIFIDNLIGQRGTVRASSLTNGFQVTLDRKVGTLVAAWLPCTSLEKIEPEYRPFANAAEFEPHRDRWLRRHTKRGAFRVIDYSNECVYMQPSETDGCTYKWMFDAGYKFDDDGTPFGVEVTQ